LFSWKEYCRFLVVRCIELRWHRLQLDLRGLLCLGGLLCRRFPARHHADHYKDDDSSQRPIDGLAEAVGARVNDS
jgi:hypothetical protein